MYGQSLALGKASDQPSGDFYGGKNQHRLGAKVLEAFVDGLPYEFMASKGVSLYDYTSRKCDEELLCSYATTLANAGACMIIDALNPDGTLEMPVYDRIEKIVEAFTPFRKAVQRHKPKISADVGLYFSMSSMVRRDHNGKSVRTIMDPANNMLAASDLRPMQELLGTSVILNKCKTPYRIVKADDVDLGGYKAVIVHDASFMSAAEVDRLRRYVADGGTLIATGMTSYQDLDGKTTGDLALADVLGIKLTGRMTKLWSYAVPEDGAEKLSCRSPGPVVSATTAKVLAKLSEPIFDYEDLEHFAAYHSNPPGPTSENPAVTVNTYGKGKAIYYYGSSLSAQENSPQSFGAKIFRQYAPSGIVRETNAPGAVEITLLKSTTAPAFLLCFVNHQDDLPNVPVRDVKTRITLPGGATIESAKRVSDGSDMPFAVQADTILFKLETLETVEMIEITVNDE